jgi:chemotaxis protein MotB
MASIKRKKGGGEGGANWMDTYGDMVTLLLCFFVLLYSMSTIDQEKWILIVQSFNKDAEISVDDFPRGPDGDNDAEDGNDMPMTQDEVNEEMEMVLEYLAEYAAALNASSDSMSDEVTFTKGDNYAFFSFPNSVFFRGDSSTLLDAGKEELDKLILILNEHKLYIDEIEITGHTATSLVEYNARSDRRLAALRSAEVTAYLQDNSEIQPARITGSEKGQWMPIAPNDVEENRKKNRRVEIMISFSDTELDNPFEGSIEQYYTRTEQENPDPTASMYTDTAE